MSNTNAVVEYVIIYIYLCFMYHAILVLNVELVIMIMDSKSHPQRNVYLTV